MTTHLKIGLGIIGLGIIMFFIGASMFTFRGDINPIISKIGMYSFLFWLPTIILGIILCAHKKRKKNIDRTPENKYNGENITPNP